MAIRIIRRFRDLLDVTWAGTPNDGDIPVYDTATGKLVMEAPAAAAGAAPDSADYLVGTANGTLSAEIVVGTSPGGELGGTWASPTVDTTHSGSSHASVQAAAEATAAAALLAHTTDSSDAHDASAISIADAANDFTATDVEGALAELQSDHETDATNLSNHIADATAAHAATAISFSPAGSIAATDVQAAIEEVASEAGGGGAPSDVDYLVGTASGGLSAEIVVGTSPGGELGGTWPSPTVDATHSGSSHADVQAAAEATAAAALAGHTTDSSDAHAASAISADSTTLVGTGTDVQSVLEELDNGIADHLADTAGAHNATAIAFTPAGGLAADDVAEALSELDTEKTTAAAALAAAQTEIADQKRVVEVLVTDPNGSSLTTGDGKAYFGIPVLLNGHNLVAVIGFLTGASSSGSVTVQIHNVTQAADMLSSVLTITASSNSSTTATIDTANDDVATGDIIRIDIDGAGTSAEGLIVALTFEAP